jgi:hypothetical protein
MVHMVCITVEQSWSEGGWVNHYPEVLEELPLWSLEGNSLVTNKSLLPAGWSVMQRLCYRILLGSYFLLKLLSF